MHKLVVQYPEPVDRDSFRRYYETTHLPLAARLPGVQALRYSLDVTPVDGEAPYFAIFEADFASAEDMGAALTSEQGAAVAADVANYATGGAHITHYPVHPVGPDGRQIVIDYLDRWNAHDVDGIVRMFAVDGGYTDPSLGESTISGDDLVNHLEQLFAAVPDLGLSVLAAAEDGPNQSVAFWRMRGSATGPYRSTNNGKFDLLGGDILHYDTAGKITWTAALYDQKRFFEQGGFVDTP